MPLFVIVAIDRPGRLDRRKATRGEHLQHLANHAEHIRTAGPFTDENGVPCGSMLVVETDDLADAQAMAANDPYLREGVFESVTVRPWKLTVGTGIEAKSL